MPLFVVRLSDAPGAMRAFGGPAGFTTRVAAMQWARGHYPDGQYVLVEAEDPGEAARLAARWSGAADDDPPAASRD